MPTTLDQLTLFHLAILAILFPTVTGFLMEAGRDLYNTIRKKPTASDLQSIVAGFSATCKESRRDCTDWVRSELAEQEREDDRIKEKQAELRERQLPAMDRTLENIKLTTQSTKETVSKLEGSMADFFKLWDKATMEKLFHLLEKT